MNPFMNALSLLIGAVLTPGVGPALLVGFAVGAWLAHRSPTQRMTRFAAAATLITILVFTLGRAGGAQGNHWTQRDWWWWTHGWGSMFATGQIVEFAANVAFFVPAGVAWRRLGVRTTTVISGLGGLAFGIEYAQSLLGRGAADPRDLVANVVGAAIGAALAHLALSAHRRSAPTMSRRAVRRIAALAVGSFVVVIGLGMGAGVAGAAHRQSTLRDAMRQRFDGTTRTGLLAAIEEEGWRWPTVEGAFPMTVYLHGDRETMIWRYSVAVMGDNRCVFARWRDGEPVGYRDGSGSECVEFVDGNSPGADRIDW